MFRATSSFFASLPCLLGAILLSPHAWAETPKAAAIASDPIPLMQEGSDIPGDPAVKWGLLDNGMRYAILKNAEPPNRASLRLFVDAGSLMESEEQLGLAHFLEHMAFNGTENFPPGEMVEYFQRLGMGFGNHTNAHTGFRETVYKLELPKTDTELMDEGFLLLRDYADGMLLLQEEIEDERGVILAEKLSRDSVQWRTFVNQIEFALPEIRISQRMPIGTEEVIRNANRDRFVSFYNDWYTPNRMVVIAVGDFDPKVVEGLIKKHFDSMPKREKTPTPPMGNLSSRGVASHYYYDEEASETSVSVETIIPRVDPPDNMERRRHDLRLAMASMIINRRLDQLSKQADSPIISARSHGGDFYDLGFGLYSSVSADCKPENWDAALATIEQELRRALEHGFLEEEVDEISAMVLNGAEEAAKSMGTRKSRSLANLISSRLGERRIFTSPADDLPRTVAELEKITPGVLHETLKNIWDEREETLILVSGNVEIAEPLVTIKVAYQKSRDIAVTPPVEKEAVEFAYGDLPEAGAIASEKVVEDIDVTQLQFANGVRANLKATDFEDEVVYVSARIGGGILQIPDAALRTAITALFVAGGLEAHSDDDLQRLFAGESVGVSLRGDDDAFILSGRTTPEDLETQLKLMRAFLTAPGYREEALIEFRKRLDPLYRQLATTPQGISQNEVARYIRNDDTRFGFPAREALEAVRLSDVEKAMKEVLTKSYMEITVVGDIKVDQTKNLLAATMGNLPQRDTQKPDYAEERKLSLRRGEGKTFPFVSQIPKGSVAAYWPTADIFDISQSRRLSILGAVFDDRLRVKVREELGDAYSPFAHHIPSDTFTDFGYLFGTVTVDRDQAEDVLAVIKDIANDLATGEAITEDELERAKKPQLTSIEEMRRTNRYWLGSVMESSQEYPERLEWSRTFVPDYEAITVDEVNALAKKYMDPESMLSVMVLPETE